MSEASLSPPARTSTTAPSLEAFAEAIEKELARLAEARPHLEDRIGRAAQLVVVHLSSPPRTRPVRCRIRKGGRCVMLVESLSSRGAVYEVSPDSWRCSCPDAHRRNDACKHSLVAWVLWRASLTRELERHIERGREYLDRSEAPKGCRACVDGWVYMGEDVIDSESGEVRTFHNPVRCRRCAGVEPPYLTDDELREWMASVRWQYARTMPKHPHEYSLKEWHDEERFERVVRTIWDHGYNRPYLRRPWRSLDVGEHYVWVCTLPKPRMPVPLEETTLINRALRVRKRIL